MRSLLGGRGRRIELEDELTARPASAIRERETRPLGAGRAPRLRPALGVGTAVHLVLPLATAVAGCALTFWMWERLVSERRAGAEARAAALTDSLAEVLEDAVTGQLLGFEGLLELYAVDGIPLERLEQMGREDFGLTAMVASRAGGKDPDDTLRSEARLDPPYMELSGTLAGSRLTARARISSLLSSSLDRRAPDYAIRVARGDAVLYSRGQPARNHDWWIQRRAVSFPAPLDAEWSLTVAPTATLAELPVANVPAYFRTAGVAISLLLGALLYQASIGHRRHLALERSHADLRSEMRVRERAEEELRSLNLDLERRVAERTAELDAVVADLEAFTYSVSHDLRSPLGAVVNFSGILKEDCGRELGSDGRAHLEKLTASALSALAMLDGLAALSRLGRARPSIETVDVSALAAEVFDEAVVSSAGTGARLTMGALPPARADAAMLRTVFTNLFTNALKFAAPGRPLVVEVGSRRSEGENVYWVRDNGVGFEARFAERVFRLFERLHGEEGYAGTGIGLAIVARVIRFHGGRVWAEAEPDRGACFSFTLPGAV